MIEWFNVLERRRFSERMFNKLGVEPMFSALNRGFVSTMRVTKSALTLSSEEMEVKYRRQVQGEILDVNDD